MDRSPLNLQKKKIEKRLGSSGSSFLFFLFFFSDEFVLTLEGKKSFLNKLCISFVGLPLAQQWLLLGMTHPGRQTDLLKPQGSE